MFVQQFYVESLGHYSYLIGSLQDGVAFAVDPKRDIEDYLAAAGAMGLRITHILETHLHNDYVWAPASLRQPPGRPSATARRPAWPTRTCPCVRATRSPSASLRCACWKPPATRPSTSPTWSTTLSAAVTRRA